MLVIYSNDIEIGERAFFLLFCDFPFYWKTHIIYNSVSFYYY